MRKLCAFNIIGCCIYEKPKVFGESSSSDSEDECGHCRGHKKKCYKKHLAMGQAEDGHDHLNNVDSSNKPDQSKPMLNFRFPLCDSCWF